MGSSPTGLGPTLKKASKGDLWGRYLWGDLLEFRMRKSRLDRVHLGSFGLPYKGTTSRSYLAD